MKTIYYPGYHGFPSSAFQFIRLEKGEFFPIAHIVVYQDERHAPSTSLINSKEARDLVLNRLLDTDLRGVRTDLMRFSVIHGSENGERLHCFGYKICLNFEDFVSRGNRCVVEQAPAEDIRSVLWNFVGRGQKTYSVYSHDVVGGCSEFYTEQCDGGVSEEYARIMLKEAGVTFD